MSERARPELPIRSASLDNLRPKSNLRKKLKFIDDTSTKSHASSSGSLESHRLLEKDALNDLNHMLHNKLRIADAMHNGQRMKRKTSSNSSQESFKVRSGMEGDVITVAYDDVDEDYEESDGLESNRQSIAEENSSLGENVNGEDDDEEFANVDEIDGPISGKEKNEAKMGEVDYNMPVDIEYQRSLDQRAAEIDKSSIFRPISSPRVEWSLKDFYSLFEDLPDWFCASDFSHFPQTKSQFDKKVEDSARFVSDEEYASCMIHKLIQDMSQEAASGLLALTYISMGTYGVSESLDNHLANIRRNNLLLCSELPKIIQTFKTIARGCRDDHKNLKRQTTLLFYSSTIIFFIVNVCIDLRDKSPVEMSNVISTFHETKLLQFLTQYIEHWRWNSRLSMRIRNIINLLFKLLVLQFGDKTLHRRTKEYICKLHDIEFPSNNGAKRCTISPLYYQAFREDITARFPDYVTPKAGLPTDVDNSNSLSQFLEIPRSKVRNPINLTLAAPDQHLATPAPSPPSSPNISHLCDSLRPRKSFQTNMAYPCLYPSDDEEGDDDLTGRFHLSEDKGTHDVIVPFSVQEASKILSESVEIKLSVKQLWHERKLFMMTERGWQVDRSLDPFDYSNFDSKSGEEAISIMKRVDSYYEDCLPSFNSLIFVLLQTLESNLTNIDYRKVDLAENDNMDSLSPRLEINRTKELAMKSSAGIIFLLLKWFKLNHVLKFEHFAVLLNDSRYIHICTSILSKYADNYSDKICNRMASAKSSFWEHCSTFNSAYQETYPGSQNPTNEYNIVMLSSFGYMLKIMRKVIGNKTERLKELPLSIGLLFKKYYRLFNLDIYHPILRIVKELTPFKNKRWKSEHMELISGVFLYERLELIDNWVTGKDVSGELSDACGQEIALRALLQFYNFLHYEKAMEALGYSERSNSNLPLLNKESEYLGM